MTMLSQKLKSAGYTTHFVGKWDAGSATWDHTPEGRGFDSSLIYFGHRINYFSHLGDGCNNMDVFNGTIRDLWDSGAPATGVNASEFIDYTFLRRSQDVITSFANGGSPFPTSNGPRAAAGQRLWLHHSLHATHDPIQAPQAVMQALNYTDDDETACNASVAWVWPGATASDIACRRQYDALLAVADGVVGGLVQALQAAGLWNDTLLVLTSDNGGQQDMTYNAACNWPLRGGKGSEWEGAIRAAAFVSGGYIPEALRGSVSDAMVHVADWYATFAALVGVDARDGRAAAAGLPPVDSVNVWPNLMRTNDTPARSEFAASTATLLSGNWKLISTLAATRAGWTGTLFPNSSSPERAFDPTRVTANCSAGCLFDVVADPSEHHDLASANPTIVATLTARLQQWRETFYSNNETFPYACPHDVPNANCSCWLATNVYGGYVGPFQL